MPQSYIVEIGEEAVGLVSREAPAEPFRFFASDARLSTLDGARFATPRAAEAAVRLHLNQTRRRLPSSPASFDLQNGLAAGLAWRAA